MGGYVAVKLPLLVALTLGCNGLLNGLLGLLLGTGLGFRQSLLALLSSFALAALILGSLAPVTFFLAWNAPSPGRPRRDECPRHLPRRPHRAYRIRRHHRESPPPPPARGQSPHPSRRHRHPARLAGWKRISRRAILLDPAPVFRNPAARSPVPPARSVRREFLRSRLESHRPNQRRIRPTRALHHPRFPAHPDSPRHPSRTTKPPRNHESTRPIPPPNRHRSKLPFRRNSISKPFSKPCSAAPSPSSPGWKIPTTRRPENSRCSPSFPSWSSVSSSDASPSTNNSGPRPPRSPPDSSSPASSVSPASTSSPPSPARVSPFPNSPPASPERWHSPGCCCSASPPPSGSSRNPPTRSASWARWPSARGSSPCPSPCGS